MDTLQFPQFDPPAKAHIALLRDVTNAAEVKTRIIAASTAEGDNGDAEREAVNFAFIEASLVSAGRLSGTRPLRSHRSQANCIYKRRYTKHYSRKLRTRCEQGRCTPRFSTSSITPTMYVFDRRRVRLLTDI